MLSGQNKDRVTYNQLSPVQWMAGFCRTIREESDVAIREHMLDYVIDLLDDATDFSWASAKASHAVLLCRMEQGEIKSWSETGKIDKVCLAHAQRHNISQNNFRKDKISRLLVRPLLVCIITREFARKNRPMRPKGSFISMYVPHVGPKMANLTLIHKWNVEKIPKMSNPGRGLGFESCP